jgi:hypothetical protein
MIIKCFLCCPSIELLISISTNIFPLITRVIAADLCLIQVADVISRLAAVLNFFPVMSEEAIVFVRSLIFFLRDLIEKLADYTPEEDQWKLSSRCFKAIAHLLMNRVVNFGTLALYHETDISIVINSLCIAISGNSPISTDPRLINSFFKFFEELFHVRSCLNGVDDRVYLQFLEHAKFALYFGGGWEQMTVALSAFVHDQEIVEKVRWINEDFLIDFCMSIVRWRFVMEGHGNDVLVLELLRMVSHWLVIQLCKVQEEIRTDIECQEFREILLDQSSEISEKRVEMVFAGVSNAMRMLLYVYDGSGDEPFL